MDPIRLPHAMTTPEAVVTIARYSPLVEIGAGDGRWADAVQSAGADILAFDIVPKSERVILGDHEDAMRMGTGRSLLLVWPPDGNVASSWITAHPWPFVIIIGKLSRLDLDLSSYALIEYMPVPGRRKGNSDLIVLKRNALYV